MNRNKEQMLDFLVKAFIADSDNYKNMEIPEGETQKKVVLRSLMNIRMPRKMDDEVLKVQDEYLKLCAEEKGIVEIFQLLKMFFPFGKEILQDLRWIQ